jgi:membrane protease subunit (stomatin/prohibitin family)
LSLYILRQYFPEILAAGGLNTVLQTLWVGIVNGLAIGLAGAAGGAITGRLISHHLQAGLTSVEMKSTSYKCPKCGKEYESNPKFCSNCGEEIK